MAKDPYEMAIDQILEGADGDVRLALRTLLVQNLELQARLAASERTGFSQGRSKKEGTIN